MPDGNPAPLPLDPVELPIRLPRDLQEATANHSRVISLVLQLKAMDRERDEKKAPIAQQLRDLDEEYAKQQEPLWVELRSRATKLSRYIERNRDALTDQGKEKSVQFPGGDVRWPEVGYVDIPNEKKFFAEIAQRGEGRSFIRKVREPNKKAISARKALATTFKSIVFGKRRSISFSIAGTKIRLEAPLEKRTWTWSIIEPKQKKRS